MTTMIDRRSRHRAPLAPRFLLAAVVALTLLQSGSASAQCCVCFGCTGMAFCLDSVADANVCAEECTAADCPSINFDLGETCDTGCGSGTEIPTATPTGTPTGTAQATATDTPTPTEVIDTPTATPTEVIDTPTATPTTETPLATATATAPAADTPTGTPTGTAAAETPTATATAAVGTPTDTPTSGPSSTATATGQATATATNTAPDDATATATATQGEPGTPTATPIVSSTATATNTEGAGGTPTATATASVTPTPTGGFIRIQIGTAVGQPGTRPGFSVTYINADRFRIVSISHCIAINDDVPFARLKNGDPDCNVNPAIEKPDSTFVFSPTGCNPAVDCDNVCATIEGPEDSPVIPVDSALYSCRIAIPEDAENATYPLACAGPSSAVNDEGASINVACTDGSVIVQTNLPGDCNGDGIVEINELILGVNIALEIQPVTACPAFDTDDSGGVSIDELIAAVNVALSQ